MACQIGSGWPSGLPSATPSYSPYSAQATQVIAPPPVYDPLAYQDTLISLYARVNPGVVAIRVLSADGGGLGSGFVYDSEGHIITNYHVIEGRTDIEVDFPSGLKVRGKVVGNDLDSDIAVIEVDVPPEALTPLPLGDSDQVKVGQTVVAIGNPFGYNGTMTSGIVSAVGRTMASLHQAPGGGIFTAGGIIQTDAAINPGNSGGPLLNLNGEVIGINRAIQTIAFTNEGEPINSGISFAVAINLVKRVVPTLIATGKYDYPYLGISSVEELTLLEAEALDLPQYSGAYVTAVSPNSPAERAGLRGGSVQTDIPGLLAGGDLITAIDGQPVQTFGDLLNYLISHKSPGDEVVLTILRGDQTLEVTLKLDKRP